MGPHSTASSVPLDVWLTACFPFVSIRCRWQHLALVSRAWRVAALASVKAQTHLDWTWCRGPEELKNAVDMLLEPIEHCDQVMKSNQLNQIHLTSIELYGPCVNSDLLSTLLDGVGAGKFRRISIESKQLDPSGLALLSQATRLVGLRLDCIKLTDIELRQIAKACPDLQDLSISGCSRVGDDGITAIAQNCRQLQRLDISMCIRVTDRGLHAIALHPPTLTSLTTNKCLKITDFGLAHILQTQRNLVHLSIANCPKPHDAFFRSISSLALHRVSFLGCVAIDDVSPAPHIPGGFTQFLNKHTLTLESIDLTGLLNLKSQSFQRLAICTHLTALNLSLCRGLTDDDMNVIAAGCCVLQTLSLQGCVRIGDSTLRALATHCTALRDLSLVFCFNITDTGFCAIANQCLRLARINVKACNLLTIRSFETLAARPGNEPLIKAVVGACADLATTATYANVLRRAFPECFVMWT
ncbi:hypothetical protein LEN26_014446 [Aphanomyces euteiches]|nr:hypothetical protein LEN26_014446 [Aphanomyces euteiches]